MNKELKQHIKDFLHGCVTGPDHDTEWAKRAEYLLNQLSRKRGRQPGTKYPRKLIASTNPHIDVV